MDTIFIQVANKSRFQSFAEAQVDGSKNVYVRFRLLARKGEFRAKINGKLLVCPVVCLTDGVGCVGAGLALSEGNEDKNDSDIDDDGSDGGRRPGAISQNIVSCRCRPFVEVVLILTFYLGVPLGFVILWHDICFLRVYMCMYVIALNRTICPCPRQHYMLLTSVLPKGVNYTRTTPSDPTRQREHTSSTLYI